MHHATAQDLQPARAFANRTATAIAKHTADVHFRTGFREWEITGPEPYFHILAEHLLYKKVQGLFQVRERHVLIDI